MAISLPTHNQHDWDVPLNAALNDLDTRVITAQTSADAAQTSANNAQISANNSVQHNDLVINIKDYGAVGDGATNDQVAFTNAIAAAVAANIKTVLIPRTAAGYGLASSISLDSNVTLLGEPGATLKATVATARMIEIPAAADNVTIQGLSFNANGLVTSQIVRLNACTNVKVIYNTFSDASNAALFGVDTIATPTDILIANNTFNGIQNPVRLYQGPKRVRIHANRILSFATRGIYAPSDATYALDGLWITQNHITGLISGLSTPGMPISIDGNTANLNKNVHITGNTVVGPSKSFTAAGANKGTPDQITIQAAQEFEVSFNISTDGGDNGITIGSDAINGSVVGNVCNRNDTGGIDLGVTSVNGARNVTVSGNVCLNNGQNRNADRAASGRVGIYVSKGTDLLITGNRCGDDQGVKTQQYGIAYNNLTGALIGVNHLTGNGTAATFAGTGNTAVTLGTF